MFIFLGFKDIAQEAINLVDEYIPYFVLFKFTLNIVQYSIPPPKFQVGPPGLGIVGVVGVGPVFGAPGNVGTGLLVGAEGGITGLILGIIGGEITPGVGKVPGVGIKRLPPPVYPVKPVGPVPLYSPVSVKAPCFAVKFLAKTPKTTKIAAKP